MHLASESQARAALAEQFTWIRNIARQQAFRRGLPEAEAEEFVSVVLEKLLEDDCRRLRSFRAEASLKSYLYAVVRHLLHDYCNGLWGKWRPSRKAQRAGIDAVDLERLICRDGLSHEEAVATLNQRNGRQEAKEALDEALLCAVASRAPRGKRSMVPLDCLDTTPSNTGPQVPDELAMRDALSRVQAALEWTS